MIIEREGVIACGLVQRLIGFSRRACWPRLLPSGSRWDTGLALPSSDWLTFVAHMVQRAWVGDRRAARMAGSSPARAPMATAAARPPAQAWDGMTTASPWLWA